jgi:hypothetical protein
MQRSVPDTRLFKNPNQLIQPNRPLSKSAVHYRHQKPKTLSQSILAMRSKTPLAILVFIATTLLWIAHSASRVALSSHANVADVRSHPFYLCMNNCICIAGECHASISDDCAALMSCSNACGALLPHQGTHQSMRNFALAYFGCQ